jgi:ubiquinone/menaquinone biosynthesis C-methylase UbiE
MKSMQAPSDEHVGRRELLRNAIAEGADREALRFSAFCADRFLTHLQLAPGDKILDVYTGTGALALAASQAVGPAGRVTAIDTAENLLARLGTKISKFGIANIDVHSMDAAHLDFRRDYFQHTACSLGLFWLSDPPAAMREWVRVTRPGGSVSLTVFAPQAFQPQLGLLLQRIAQVTGSLSTSVSWEQLSRHEALLAFLQDAGLVEVTVQKEQLGYHLRDAQEWWEVVWHSALRLLVEQVPAALRDRLRTEHLAEVAALATADGLWLDVAVLFARGYKPLRAATTN